MSNALVIAIALVCQINSTQVKYLSPGKVQEKQLTCLKNELRDALDNKYLIEGHVKKYLKTK